MQRCQRQHANIANLLDKFEPEITKCESHGGVLPVMVLEYAPISVVALIEREHIPFSRLESFVSQLNEGLQFLRACGVVHRDINPANLQLTSTGTLKIIDFGSATFVDSAQRCNNALTPDVCTLWYRAPETFAIEGDGSSYSFSVDMWSFGCVLAELCTGRPIFDEADENEELALIKNKDIKAYLTDRILLLNDDNVLLIDMISRMLEIDPKHRIIPSEVRSHDYLRVNNPIPHHIYFKHL